MPLPNPNPPHSIVGSPRHERVAVQALQQLGGFSMLVAETARETLRRRPEGRVLMEQLYQIGVLSVGISTVIALFTGMVLALQTALLAAAFGAKLYVGEVVALSLVRELGPVLTALMVGGRVGAGITAELGTMTVTEQVDAMRALGADPVRKLVVPRSAGAADRAAAARRPRGLPRHHRRDCSSRLGARATAGPSTCSTSSRPAEPAATLSGLAKTVFFAFDHRLHRLLQRA